MLPNPHPPLVSCLSLIKPTTRLLIIALILLTTALVHGAEESSSQDDSVSRLRGPDGLYYPDFRYAGVPGGIPAVPVVAKVTDFGGKPDDGKDDSAAILKAVASAAKKGGGAVYLAPGRWHLDSSVDISDSGIVLRGAGQGKTTLESRYRQFTQGEITLSHPATGVTVGTNDYLEVLFDPAGMRSVSITLGDQVVARRGSDRGRNVEYWFRLPATRLADAVRKAGRKVDGEHTITVTISGEEDKNEQGKAGTWAKNAQGIQEWQNAAVVRPFTRSMNFKVMLREDSSGETKSWSASPSVIAFYGARLTQTWGLAEDARRGDLSLLLDAIPTELKRGDVIELRFTPSATYRNSILSFIPKDWGVMQWQAVVESVEGNRVHLNQPLRVDFPKSESPIVRKTLPVKGVGVESLTFVQSTPCLVNSFSFTQAYGSWLRDVEVVKTGRNPFVFDRAKFSEVRDLVATDAWFGVRDNMGGGTAYISFDSVWDCLLDGAVIRGLRHAPNLQAAAQGNVMRRLDTLGTDIQWHAFLTAENLIESSKIRSLLSEGGTYGYGAYASGPDSHVHGPNLQGNVVYGNDIESSETSVVHRGGPTARGWIFAYNRFTVKDQGMALHVQLGLPDLTFIGNICVTPNPAGLYGVASYRAPGSKPRAYNIDEGAAVWVAPGSIDGESFPKPEFARLKVTGLRVLNNRFYGFKQVLGGAVADVQERNNQLLPYAQEEPLPKPDLPAPSLYFWQKQQYPLSRSTWPTHPAAYAR